MAIRIGRTGAGFESVPVAPIGHYSKTAGFLTTFALRLASFDVRSHFALRRTLLKLLVHAARSSAGLASASATRVRVTA